MFFRRGNRLAALVIVCASALVIGASGQAVAARTGQYEPGAAAAPIGISTSPMYWIDSGQQFINFHSGKCVGVDSSAVQARVVQRTCTHANGWQRWAVEHSGDGYAMLRNKGSGLCMDLYANTEEEIGLGTPIQVFYCWNGYVAEQWWRSAGSRPDHFQVRNRFNGNLCLVVKDNSTAEGAPIELWGCQLNNLAQQFRFLDSW